LVVGIAAASFAGYLISFTTLRLREDYLAIVTIACGEILRIIFLYEDWIRPARTENLMGGFKGMPIDNPFRSGIDIFGWIIRFPDEFRTVYLGLVLVFLIAVLIFVQALVNSPYGRVMKGLREDVDATEGLGKGTFRFKTEIFVIGSGIAGLAGGLYAYYIGFIAPDSFLPTLTFTVWIMMIIGGKGNNYSVIVGAALITFLERSARLLKGEDLDLFGWTITFEDYFPKMDRFYKFGTREDEAAIFFPADILTLILVGSFLSLGCFAIYKGLKAREDEFSLSPEVFLVPGFIFFGGALAAMMLQARVEVEIILTNLTDIITPFNTTIILLFAAILGIIYVGGIPQIKNLPPKSEPALIIALLAPLVLFILALLFNIKTSWDIEFFSSRQQDIYYALLLVIAPIICLAVAYIALEELLPSQFIRIRTALFVLLGLTAIWVPVTLTLMLPIEAHNFRLILTGGLLIFFVMFRPQGMIPEMPLSVAYEKEGVST
jgi:ABC-type branched-subunit amino acid transport system permease subunit